MISLPHVFPAIKNLSFSGVTSQDVTQFMNLLIRPVRDFPGGPVVKNPPSNAVDTVSELRAHRPWGN